MRDKSQTKRKGAALADRYETRFDSDYDAPRMRGIAFWNADWFRFSIKRMFNILGGLQLKASFSIA
jgi:hypothetical protein